ncbi:fibrinogen-like protein 1 [Drosophila navojoa]|uniref:fibrinogen-like protein 1 n=1 Tax=Drosophila navojoa TaxID=7232 RepID=UPI0011BDD443|nr:fibrinogen-like protein 1 [Drosophila navojoa]
MVIQSRNNIIEQVNVEQKNTDSAILKLKTENAIDVAKTREIESIGKQSNIVEIKLPGSSPFNVSCDSTLVDSGWTVIQRRQDGSEKFDRTMKDYQSGFGKPTGEFFMGLNKIHLLTQYKQHELYIYLKNFNNEVRYARYSDFLIGGEEENFKLKSLGEYSGDAGDAMVHHLNMQFSTLDADHDNWGTGNCAEWLHSGWWFDKCGKCNLNGLYRAENHMYEKWGVNWFSWTNTSLKFVQMMIRPKVKL